MLKLLKKILSDNLFFSYKLTALVTILASLINLYFWFSGNYYNVFSGYTINPNATMKIITSLSFLIVGAAYYFKDKNIIRLLLIGGLLIQFTEFILIFFNLIDPIEWHLSSLGTISMFILTYLAMYFIKIRRLKVVFLLLNGLLYILSSFAVFYYLLDMNELNKIPGFESLSWNTAMLFFMNAISLFELKLVKRIDTIKLDDIINKKTHPYNYFPYFFLVPIILIVIISILAYYKIISIVQAAFFIILFLNTSSFINMFFYSYNFIKFYMDITKKSSQLRTNNRKLNALNTELEKLNKNLKKKNTYLEDFATITSHNLREPIIALKELQKVTKHVATENSFTNEEVQDMYYTTIRRLNQGINSLVQYHDFIKNEEQTIDQKTSLQKEIKKIFSDLENILPKEATLSLNIEEDIMLSKNCVDTIFRNLLTNSIKYKRDNIDLFIKIICFRVDNSYNILYKDNGTGINLNFFKKQLFKKRKRFHKKSNNSNGYGLYYTELCVKKLNGKIDVYSTPEKGTAFRIKLKLPLS
ncbi:sensor histidine kinase [Mesoflavibacter sp. CH_XMU1422-2]|uniref:sensor histidine kinase n=1 Tax=Mesoflavibacter sp. CH_XMU1422-2 TaxID=3107770 RepID=UPI0024375C32